MPLALCEVQHAQVDMERECSQKNNAMNSDAALLIAFQFSPHQPSVSNFQAHHQQFRVPQKRRILRQHS